jgi:transposase
MSKVKYKAKNVNKLDWMMIEKQVQGKEVLFSIDVAKADFVGLLRTRDQEVIQLISWTHPQDTRGFIDTLTGLGMARLEAAMEPTGTYGDALRWQLTQRGIPVYRVNPKHTHDESESFDGVPSSHDAKAACIIADLHLRGRSQPWPETPLEQRELRGLVDELEIHQTLHRANLNRLSAVLIRHWPELEYVISLGSISVLTLLSTYGTPANVARHADEADALLRRTGRAGLKEGKRHAMVASAQNSLGVPCVDAECQHIQSLATDLLRTNQASATVEARMSQAISERAELECLAQVCGKTTSIVLIALLGDLRRYPNAKSLLKAIGLNLKEHSSGQHKGILKITKRGPSKVRFYLYWLVLRLICHDPHIKAWYERKLARDGRRGKGRAIIAIMRKLVKGLWHVAQGQTFDSRKLFNLNVVTA